MSETRGDPPDCPKCKADGRKYVHIVVIVLYANGQERTDYACNCCGYPWSVPRPPS